MNAHTAKQEMNLLFPQAYSYGAGEETARYAAGQATRGRRGLISRLFARLAEMRERQQVISELSMLSDRELADIGLSRVDVPRVFDPAFAASRSEARGF
jgi:uncharacterized protein YjiS (DUF1127 family)